ncbi:MAG: efflux RND transporter periplasmic adaptor subunit [Candidatus Omnitrophota bacterium]
MKKIDIKDLFGKALAFIKPALSRINLKKFKPDLKDRKSKQRFIVTIMIVIVAAIVLGRMTMNVQKALFKKKAAPEEKRAPGMPAEEEIAPVKAFKIKKTDFKDTLPCIGNVKGFKEVDLKFQTNGIIESYNFEEGEKVQEGDIIASLIQKEALLKLKYSEIELNKNQKIFDAGGISPLKLDQARLEYESARNELDKTNIYAISDGLLGSRILDVGSYVTPGDKVGIFVQMDKAYAEFNIIEKDVPKVSLGQKAEIFVDAYPDKTYNATVDRIAPIIEGRSRTETIKMELENKEGLLKPGMFVRGLIATYEKKDAIVIPSSGLKKKENDYFVYSIGKDEPKKEAEGAKPAEKKKGLWPFGFGKEKQEEPPKPASKEKKPEFGIIEVRKIKVGYMTQDLVEVEEGLKEDDLIVIEMQEEFKDKARVEMVEIQEGLS